MNKKIDFRRMSEHTAPEESQGYLLWRVSTAWRGSIEAVLKPLDLTHPQFVILATLGWLTKDADSVTQGAVGKLAGLDPNTTSQVLRGLEAKKLIKRVTSVDQRAKNPSLSAQGRAKLAQAMPVVEKADREFFSVLTAPEAQGLGILFQKLLFT